MFTCDQREGEKELRRRKRVSQRRRVKQKGDGSGGCGGDDVKEVAAPIFDKRGGAVDEVYDGGCDEDLAFRREQPGLRQHPRRLVIYLKYIYIYKYISVARCK